MAAAGRSSTRRYPENTLVKIRPNFNGKCFKRLGLYYYACKEGVEGDIRYISSIAFKLFIEI